MSPHEEQASESDSSDGEDPPGMSVVSLSEEDEASVPSGAESEGSGDEFDNLLEEDDEAGSDGGELEDDWVLRQAKEEWVARGFALEDFSKEFLAQVKREEAEFIFTERSREKKELRAMMKAERESQWFYREERRLFMQERWAMSAEDECVVPLRLHCVWTLCVCVFCECARARARVCVCVCVCHECKSAPFICLCLVCFVCFIFFSRCVVSGTCAT